MAAQRHHPANKSQVLSVVTQLRDLHAMGWVHGDIRPANMLFPQDAESEGFLIDFDMAGRVGMATPPTYPEGFVFTGLEIDRHRDARSGSRQSRICGRS